MLAQAIATKVRETLPSAEVKTETIQAAIDFQLENVRKLGTLVMMLGALAVSLALMGIYGVVSFAVGLRAKEMGIRIALGAQNRDIYRVTLASSARPIVAGLLLGLALAFGAGTALSRMLLALRAPFTVDTHDPLAYAIAVLLFLTVTMAAMIGPARRATKVDPMVALRCE
jgi:ABC-type antimicrobial peptide transport system permease subunit